MSQSIENFIKEFYKIQQQDENPVNGSVLAMQLGVSKAAVTDMLRKLNKQGLVNYEKYKTPELTEEGLQLALKILRRHRLWESFLHQTLALDIEHLHDAAEDLEHHSSDLIIDAIEQYLGHPEADMHGDPIPDKQGILPDLQQWPLLETEANEKVAISRLPHEEDGVKRFLQHHHLQLGTALQVKKSLQQDDWMLVEDEQKEIVIPQSIAQQIYVRKK